MYNRRKAEANLIYIRETPPASDDGMDSSGNAQCNTNAKRKDQCI